MSELTQCNFCSLQEVRRRAKKDGMRVTLRPGWDGGTDVFVHPKNVTIPQGQQHDDSRFRKKYCRQWMKEIGEQCGC